MKYAIVKDNKTVNIIEYDGSEPLEAEGTLIEATDSTYIGGVYSNGIFEDKPIPEDTRTYVEFRQEAYPSLQDQADMAYWDRKNGTTTLDDAIAAVKDANPKP